MQNPINLTDPTGMSPEGDPVNPPKDAKEGQTHSEHRNSTTFNYTYECGSWTETEAIIDPVLIKTESKNASGVSDDSLWRYAPVVGSGLDAYDAFSRGDFWTGVFHTGMAVSDLFLVKSLAVGAGKFAARQYAKASVQIADNLAARGVTTVLGHYPQYVKVAETIGARTFQIPTNIWNKMTPLEQWAANQKFLDRMILRGDKIRLATPINKIKPKSFFEMEINYLFKNGYKVSSDGLWMIKY